MICLIDVINSHTLNLRCMVRDCEPEGTLIQKYNWKIRRSVAEAMLQSTDSVVCYATDRWDSLGLNCDFYDLFD